MVAVNAEIMPKFEGKSAKSLDSTFKLFGRTIAVKNPCDSSSNGIHVDGIPAEAVNSAVCKASETHHHDEKQKQNEDSEKVGKKPTKLVPCPRCESMDTKFCYFNNYNVNQPRHYCRRCQRYWTAGGSLRNVPVGAGRRKNKPCFGINHRQIMDDTETGWNDVQGQASHGNSDKLVKVEPFYPEFEKFREGLNEAATPKEGNSKPQSKIQSQFDDYSHPSTVNLAREKVGKEVLFGSGNQVGAMGWPGNSTHLAKDPGNSTYVANEPGNFTHMAKELESVRKPSCSSEKTQTSATKADSAEPVDDLTSDSNLKSEPKNMSPDGSSSSSSSMNYTGTPWPVYYNGCWGSFPPGVEGSEKNRVPWYTPGTGFLPTGFNWPVPSGVMWGLPWMAGNGNSESKTLGKHQREETPQAVPENNNRSLWAPKTLRMDDPEEAARSSFLTNLGLENKKEGSIKSGEILKGFQLKMDNKDDKRTTSVQVLCANPAALSISSSFLESS